MTTWAHALPTAALALALLLVPGYLLARGLGLARLQALGGAPALAMTAIGSLTVLFHLRRVSWTLPHVLAGIGALTVGSLLIVTVGTYLSLRWRGLIAPRSQPALVLTAMVRSVRAGSRPWWPVIAALALTGATVAGAVVHGIGPADTPMQASDGLWHLNALSYVRAQADAYPIGSLAPMYWGEIHYYPTAWHALAAILPGEPTVVANTLVVIGLAVVWPTGCASLLSAVHTAADRRLLSSLPLVAGILASGAALGPTVLAGMIWPYAWAVCLLPGVLGLVMAARPRSRSGRRQAHWVAGGWCAVGLASLGLVAVHGASVFNLAVTALPALVLVGLFSLVRAWRRGGLARLGALGVLVAGVAALVAGAEGFGDQLAMLAGYERGGADPWAVMREIVRDDAMVSAVRLGGSGSTSLFVLACLGAVVVVWRQRYRWAPAVALLAGFLVVTSVMPGTPFQNLSSPWYLQRARIVPLLEIPLLVLVMAAVEEACRQLQGALDARRRGLAHGDARAMAEGTAAAQAGSVAGSLDGDEREWRGGPLPLGLEIDLARLRRQVRALTRWWQAWWRRRCERLVARLGRGRDLAALRRCWAGLRLPASAAVVLAVVTGVVIPLPARAAAVSTVMAGSYQPAVSGWKVMLSAGEAQFIRQAATQLPADAVVLGVPTNGSAYFWALTGHDVIYPTLRRYREADRLYVAANASQVLYDVEVCQALRRLGAFYLYTDTDTTALGAPGGSETPRFATTIDQIPPEALTVVAQQGSWTLSHISYCDVSQEQGQTAPGDGGTQP